MRLFSKTSLTNPAFVNSYSHQFILSVCLVFSLDICFSFQFDEEFLNRQEAQTQLIKCEEKMTQLQAELQNFRSQVQTPYSVLLLFTISRNFEKCALYGVSFFFFFVFTGVLV